MHGPAVFRRQEVPRQLNRFQLREDVEERVARCGDEDGVAWIAEELEEPGIGLAGGGSQDEAFPCGLDAVPRVVARYRAASEGSPPGVGLVERVRRRAERLEVSRGRREINSRRIRDGQVDE